MNSSLNRSEIMSSTPKGKQNKNNENLSPIDITDILISRGLLTPITKSENKREKLSSILKNSPNKSNNSFSRNELSESLLKKHPELNMATFNGELNPVKGARVLFSPTKEILSYRKEYLETSDSEEENTSHLRNLSKNKKKNKSKNRAQDNSENKEQERESLSKIENGNAEGGESFIRRALTDPTIPYILSLYLQLFFNLVLISIILYFLSIFIRTIRSDIHHKLEIYTQEASQAIRECTHRYYEYKCSVEEGKKRAPGIESHCSSLEKCMNRDPSLLGKSKVTAETFADIVNGFVKPISWKAIIFLILLVFGSIFVTNIAFGSYRNSSNIKNSQKDKEQLESLEKKIKEQEALMMKYEYLQERFNESNNGHLGHVSSYMITNSANSPRVHQLQSPQNFNSQMVLNEGV